jgi:hypothetical protein
MRDLAAIFEDALKDLMRGAVFHLHGCCQGNDLHSPPPHVRRLQ